MKIFIMSTCIIKPPVKVPNLSVCINYGFWLPLKPPIKIIKIALIDNMVTLCSAHLELPVVTK